MNREGFKENVKIALMLAAIFLMIAVPVAIAVYNWNMNITWTFYVAPDETIEVYTDVACTIAWDHTLDLIDVSTPQNFDFYVKNEGNVAVDVTITENSLTGATVSWTPTSLADLAIDASAQMTLTITFTTDGSYDFDFESNESP